MEKNHIVHTRITALELAAFTKVADLSGQSLSAWIRVQLRLAVVRVMASDQTLLDTTALEATQRTATATKDADEAMRASEHEAGG